MGGSRRFFEIVAVMIAFALIAPSPSIGSTSSSSAASTHASSTREKFAKGDEDLVAVEMPESTCEQGICVDIIPKDHKVEGKPVSQMNAAGVNAKGQIVGLCVLEESKASYPFVREPDGDIWLFKTPAPNGQGEFTDISDSGAAVGFYEKDGSHAKTGFLMNSHKQFEMDIRYPDNPCPKGSPYLHTQPNGINDSGEIIGNFRCTENPNEAVDGIFKGSGFYRAPNGTYYRVEYENAKRTVAGKITNDGVIIGYYVLNDDTWVPFAAMKDEVIKPIIP